MGEKAWKCIKKRPPNTLKLKNTEGSCLICFEAFFA